MAYSYMSSSVSSSSSSSSSSDGGVEQQQQQQQQGPQQLGYSHSNSNGNGNGLLDTLYSGLSLSAAAATTMTRRSPSPSPSPAYLPLHRTGTAGCTEHAVDVDADGDSNTNEHEHDEEDEMDRLIKSEKGAFIYGYTGAAYPQSQPARPHPHPQPPLCALIASLASLIPRSSSQRQGQAYQQPATAAAAAAVAASTGSGRSNDTRSSGGSSSSSSSRSSSACTPRKVFIHLLCLAVLALAIVGLGCIVAFATGLIQKTHVYSEKALQDSGWTRRPITIAAPAALPDKEDSAEPEHSRQAGQPQSQSQSQQRILGTPSSGVTIHDFTPSFPRNALPSNGNGTRPGPSGAAVSSHTPADRVPSNELHLLILCPLRNAAGDLAHFFRLLDTLMHPVSNTSLGFLVGDEDDDTGNVLHSLVRARMEDQPDPLKRYRHVSLLHRDFKVEMPSGSNRHSYVLQTQRRTVMARARTYLLTATLEPTVDWVLWLDSDISEFSPSLFQDLLIYGSAGVANAPAPAPLGNSNSNSNSQRGEPSVAEVDANAGPDAGWNDIIVPNAMKRRPDGSLLGFDMNNWAETPESLALRRTLDPSDLLIEGNIWQHMHRQHLADFYTSYLPADGSPYAPGSTGDVIRTESTAPDADAAAALATDAEEAEAPALGPQIFSSAFPPPPHDPRMNASHPAYIGAQMPLDGIGGVAALVRAEVHRMGATFPAWIFENQLETEAFGVLAKKLGARIVGLPNLFVLHKS